MLTAISLPVVEKLPGIEPATIDLSSHSVEYDPSSLFQLSQ